MKALISVILGAIFFAALTTPTLVSTVLPVASAAEPKAPVYHPEEHFSSQSNPSKVRILEKLGSENKIVSDTVFNQAIADESYEVRRAAVIQFIQTRTLLSVAEQTGRFQKSFALRPYQARLDAMLAFLDLPSKERTQMSAAVDARFKSACKTEIRAEVKEACEKILSSDSVASSAKESK